MYRNKYSNTGLEWDQFIHPLLQPEAINCVCKQTVSPAAPPLPTTPPPPPPPPPTTKGAASLSRQVGVKVSQLHIMFQGSPLLLSHDQ